MTYTPSAMDKLTIWHINLTALTSDEMEQVAAQVNENDDHETVAQVIATVTDRHVVLAQRPMRRNKFYSKIQVNAYDYQVEMGFNAPFVIVCQWNQ